MGIIGIVFILGLCFLLSNNKKNINYRTVCVGLILQFLIAFFVLKTSVGQSIFKSLGNGIQKILNFAVEGGNFVFGFLTDRPEKLTEVLGAGADFVFALTLIPVLIFVMVLVNMLYYFGIMQRVILFFGKGMYKLMNITGAEAVSNIASAFIGQVEAQMLIKPHLKKMSLSQLLASMTGSLACISGSIMAVYIGMGVPAEYLLAASFMAAPGALVVSKIVFPEDKKMGRQEDFALTDEKVGVNLIDAIANGAGTGLKVALNIIAMLIGLIALIALFDYLLGIFGAFLVNSLDVPAKIGVLNIADLSLSGILGIIFSGFAFLLGVPINEIITVGSLMGEKLVFNEFIAYMHMTGLETPLSAKAFIIASFALCGFANFGSIAMQIGGIGELEPSRKQDLAKLGYKALVCGTLTSYISAAIAGLLL
ncbi:MAG: NupC/NupG family nucleoside CNT transporter [Alphaproteobacteria bacterium]|nr:NupC/NupG family nucleoside CNT transporter [Alphaproteobacteria bacterium]